MTILLLYNQPPPDSAPDELDVLVQCDAVAAALRQLGHTPVPLGCTLNLEDTRRQLTEARPDLVFNLVESLGGTDRLMPLATLLLDALGVPYTGCRTEGILATSGKLIAKRRLRAARLPTPPWLGLHEPAAAVPAGTYIIKAVWEHASVGLDDAALVDVTSAVELTDHVRRRSEHSDRPCFAEQFIDGREFNLSLLTDGGRPCVLPPAEIDFSAFAPGKPRIVGYSAKWAADSDEYRQTPRRFDFPTSDRPLLDRLSDLARACWNEFELRGYARVDFRIDPEGRPWILEINANPCLSPDAGFVAALQQAGIEYPRAIERIVDDAMRP
jgi:D-alanine-D-alanine ligase